MEYPVSKGQTLMLSTTRTGEPGEAVAQHEGLTIFVNGALPGERVKVRITECAPRYARAELTEIEVPSPYRAAASCPLYGRCGGCALQHMNAEAQAMAKTEKVVQVLHRLGGFAPGSYELEPIVAPDSPFHYRNKAVYACAQGDGRAQLGLYEPESHDLAATTQCLLQNELANRAARITETWINRFHLAPYDPSSGKGLVRHLVVRTNKKGKLLAVLVANAHSLPHTAELADALKAEIPNFTGLVLNRNTRKNTPILSGPCETLYGREFLEEELLGLNFRISPLSFFQVNPVQTERLYSIALSYANLSPSDTALDAYCGSGTIALLMAQSTRRVIGVELYEGAVRDARENAARNRITNAEFHCGSCETVLPRLIKQGLRFDAATVDPPRKGCDKSLLRALLQAAPTRIVYVSCNPSTLARDLRTLTEGGYAIKKLRPVDMFPLTGHVESVVLLTKVHN